MLQRLESDIAWNMDDTAGSAPDNRLLKTGIIGTLIAAVCCFTPVLVILVSAVGLSAITGYLDYVLFPALAMFILITIYALWKRRMA